MPDRLTLIARMGAAIATADEATQALLRDALAALVEDHGIIAATERRRAKDRKRKRSVDSSESVESVESSEAAEFAASSPPAPSPSFPTPHITPSSPPSPTSASAAAAARSESSSGETDDEAGFYREIASPEFAAIATRFLVGKSPTARIAWVGRFRGAMARPPHPTIGELADALEDLMTRPPEDWTPTVFRTFVGRIRRDATRESVRDADLASQVAQGRVQRVGAGRSSSGDHAAEAAWQETLALLPRWHRREVTEETFAAMAPPMKAAISAIGGFQPLSTTPDDRRSWIKKEFVEAYRRASASQAPEAKSA